MSRKYTLSDAFPEPTEADRRRFRELVDTETTPDGCHNWKGSFGNMKDPRGKFQAQGIQDAAYRWAVVLAGRILMKGEVVNHKCNNPKCVRRDHLEVTDKKGDAEHMVRSDRHGHAKLTVSQAKAIQREWAESDRPMQKEIARRHGVTPGAISKLVNGRTWRRIHKK